MNKKNIFAITYLLTAVLHPASGSPEIPQTAPGGAMEEPTVGMRRILLSGDKYVERRMEPEFRLQSTVRDVVDYLNRQVYPSPGWPVDVYTDENGLLPLDQTIGEILGANQKGCIHFRRPYMPQMSFHRGSTLMTPENFERNCQLLEQIGRIIYSVVNMTPENVKIRTNFNPNVSSSSCDSVSSSSYCFIYPEGTFRHSQKALAEKLQKAFRDNSLPDDNLRVTPKYGSSPWRTQYCTLDTPTPHPDTDACVYRIVMPGLRVCVEDRIIHFTVDPRETQLANPNLEILGLNGESLPPNKLRMVPSYENKFLYDGRSVALIESGLPLAEGYRLGSALKEYEPVELVVVFSNPDPK